MWRTAAILAPVPLAALVMACVSPAASSDDLSPALERSMLYASIVQAAAAIMVWANAAPWHPCHSLTTLPGVLACAAVPLFGMRDALHYWPAHRCAMVASGALQFVRTAAQAHALRLADAAAALGLTTLLPASAAMQCQAHPLFLPGGVSQSAALGFGLVALVTGLALTPATRRGSGCWASSGRRSRRLTRPGLRTARHSAPQLVRALRDRFRHRLRDQLRYWRRYCLRHRLRHRLRNCRKHQLRLRLRLRLRPRLRHRLRRPLRRPLRCSLPRPR